MNNRELSEVHRRVPLQLQSHQLLVPSCCRTLVALRALTYDPLTDDRQTYQKLRLRCRVHLVHLDDRLDVHLVRRLFLELPRQQIRLDHLRHLAEVHQIHLDDLPLDEVHQIHLVLRLCHLVLHLCHLVRLDEVRQIRLDVRRDLQLVDLVRLDVHQLDEVRQLRCCHLDERLVHRMKMDYFPRAVAAARK